MGRRNEDLDAIVRDIDRLTRLIRALDRVNAFNNRPIIRSVRFALAIVPLFLAACGIATWRTTGRLAWDSVVAIVCAWGLWDLWRTRNGAIS